MSKLVGFMGAPGTGKTVLACGMKEYCLKQKVSADICTEYAREFCFEYGVNTAITDQYRITSEQMKREDLLTRGNNEYIFSDSPVWLSYIFALLVSKRGDNIKNYHILNDIYKKFVIDQVERYHRVFYLKNSNPYDDGCRDMELNSRIADLMESFVISHAHILPIVEVEIEIEEIEERKKMVWENL